MHIRHIGFAVLSAVVALGIVLSAESAHASVACRNVEQWPPATVYTGSETVRQDDLAYRAKWWTQNPPPRRRTAEGPPLGRRHGLCLGPALVTQRRRRNLSIHQRLAGSTLTIPGSPTWVGGISRTRRIQAFRRDTASRPDSREPPSRLVWISLGPSIISIR
jgi:hypothetical protein